jgi:hypothetical protein
MAGAFLRMFAFDACFASILHEQLSSKKLAH